MRNNINKMRLLLVFVICLGFVSVSVSVNAQQEIKKPAEKSQQQKEVEKQDQPEKKKDIYDEKADAAKDIEAALARAKVENRRVLIQWGANWCGWCHWLHDLFAKNSDIARKLLYEYDVVLVDIGKWDKNLDLVEKYGADLKNKGVPYLTILDAEGNVLLNQETGALEKQSEDGKFHHDPEKIVAMLTEHQAEYKKAEAIVEAGLKQAKQDGKVVYLHFGAPWCGWCHRLEDWMALEEVHKILSKYFVDVKVDVDRTVGGQEMKTKYRGKEGGGIPWFMFMDSEGKVLVTSDDEDGNNIGCPYKDEEIAAFAIILKKAAPGISKKELEFLSESLVNLRDKK